MKKNFIIAILLIIIGNTIITIAEKSFVKQQDFEVSKEFFLQAKSNETLFVQHPLITKLLSNKLGIWISTFVILVIIVNLFFNSRKKYLFTILICFYILGCSVNIFSIPHPLWFKIGVVPVVIASFLISDQLISGIKSIYNSPKNIEIGDQIWQVDM